MTFLSLTMILDLTHFSSVRILLPPLLVSLHVSASAGLLQAWIVLLDWSSRMDPAAGRRDDNLHR